MIELVKVTKTYNAGKPSEFTAVSGASLSVKLGKCTVFKGPSGSGKTTLLSLIGCMARPTEGRIFFNDKEVTSLTERFLTPIRRNSFGFVFQNYQLIEGISVLENVMIPAYPTGKALEEIKRAAITLLERLGMTAKALVKVESLSGGERQRTAIARALINDPQVIIADEPTAHLDTRLATEFLAVMEQFLEEGKTILIASHDPLVFEAGFVNRVIELRDGKVVGMKNGR
jgi:putative ABC transport system ATP-binding protein